MRREGRSATLGGTARWARVAVPVGIRRGCVAVTSVLVWSALVAGAGFAQRPSAVLGADSATVGDPVPLLLRVPHAEGETVRFPDTLALGGDLEFLGVAAFPEEARVPGMAAIAYSITAWRPGEHPLPAIDIPVATPSGSRAVRVEPPALRIVTVLPEDTAGIEPRPPKDVIGPNRTLLPALLIAALLTAAAIAFARWLLERRRARAAAGAVAIPPADRALAELERIRKEGLVERGEVKQFYVRTTRALRDYLNAVEPAWGAGLTTAEIDAHVDPGLQPSEKRDLVRVLFQADRVKFARYAPEAEEPEDLWRATREWIVAHEAELERRRAAAAEALAS